MLGGVLLVTVGGVILYAAFTPYWDRPWELITETIGGKASHVQRTPAARAAPHPVRGGFTSGQQR